MTEVTASPATGTMPETTSGSAPVDCPTSNVDLYDPASLIDPYANYSELREQGGVVHLSKYDLFALPRYDTTRAALEDWSTFSSASGVMLNDVMNDFMKGTLLCSDPPAHDVMRKVIMRPLGPKALRELQPEISEEADALIERLCDAGSFNAAADLAQHLPLTIVANRVGLPPVQRDSMLRWAPAAFNCNGPIEKELTQEALPVLQEIGGFIGANGAREQVAPESWLGGLYRAADEGLIPHEACAPMSFDYIAPALDTTISATASAIWLFARNPEQWELVRNKPSLIPNAINEVVRLETPIQGWTRMVTRDVEMDGVTIPAGKRILLMFGSANRDERKWDGPTRFDVTRKVTDHVGFGGGEHACAGANLARLEMTALFTALARRVTRFELTGEPKREVNNITRVWADIPIRVH